MHTLEYTLATSQQRQHTQTAYNHVRGARAREFQFADRAAVALHRQGRADSWGIADALSASEPLAHCSEHTRTRTRPPSTDTTLRKSTRGRM